MFAVYSERQWMCKCADVPHKVDGDNSVGVGTSVIRAARNSTGVGGTAAADSRPRYRAVHQLRLRSVLQLSV